MRTGRPTEERKDSTIQLRLSGDMRAWVDKRSLDEGISISGFIRFLIKQDMARAVK